MKMKQILAGVLTAAMVLACAPVSSLAAEGQGMTSRATVDTSVDNEVTYTDIDLTDESSYTITDVNTFNSMSDFTLTVVGKYAGDTSDISPFALFSLMDENNNYLTVWYAPQDGTVSYAYSNAGTKSGDGLMWSGNARAANVSAPAKNFKISFSFATINGAPYLCASENGSCRRTDLDCSTFAFFREFFTGHGWTATKALIGKAPVNNHPLKNNRGNIDDFVGTIDRVTVSNTSLAATTTADATTEIKALNNASTSAYKTKLQTVLNSCNYEQGSASTEAWTAYTNAKSAAETKVTEESPKDWEVLDAMDTLTAAVEGLTQSELTIKEDTICANSWYAETHAKDGSAAWAFDKNDDGSVKTATHWHSNYGTTNAENKNGAASATNPIYIQAGFDEAKYVKRISYRGRVDQASNWITGFEILAANSTETKPADDEFVSVMKGNLAAPTTPATDERIIDLPYAIQATHIRIQATSVSGSNGYVTASNIKMYETSDTTNRREIVSLANKAVPNDANMGTVSMTPAKGIAGENTTVTLTANEKSGYHFVRWDVTGAEGETVPEGPSVQVTLNSADSKVYTAVFEEGAELYYSESDYWDKEEAAGTIATQDDSDVWHYQIRNADGWADIQRDYYYAANTNSIDFGRWLLTNNTTGSTNFHWAKISKEQMTTTFGNTGYTAVGYAWKAGAKGYYSVALESPIPADSTGGDGGEIDLLAAHVPSSALASDGESLYTGRIAANFTIQNCRIAKADVGDYIRIYGEDKNAWVTNFKPMIVEETAKAYATQYLTDLAANINIEDYTTETATAYTTAKTNLEGAIAEGVTATEDDITAKIEALEAAVAGLKEKVKFTGTTLTLDGKIGLTFYTNLTSLDGVTAASFTVDSTKTVDAVYELKNGYVACTYKLAAKEMTDEVSASITVNGEIITSAATSAASNANALLNDTNSSDTLKALAKSLLNYGAAAQVQFNYKSTELANASLEDTTVPEIGTSLDATCVDMGVTAEGYKGLSLVLNSETALKLYASGETSIILKKDGEQVAASGEEKNNTFSFAKVENIAANHLQDTYTVVLNNDETTTYTVSPLLYCYKVAKGEGFDANLKKLVNALYDYNQKAIAYGNSQN